MKFLPKLVAVEVTGHIPAKHLWLSDGTKGVQIRVEPDGKIYAAVNVAGGEAEFILVTAEKLHELVKRWVRYEKNAETMRVKPKAKGRKRGAA